MKKIIIIALLALLATNASAQIIGATDNSQNSGYSLYKPTGHYIKFEAGYPQFASIAYGYQVNPDIMFGGGLGFGYMYFEVGSIHNDSSYLVLDGLGFPLYTEVVFSTPNHAVSFLVDIKLGYNIQLGKDSYYYEYNYYFKGRKLFGAINAGIAYKNFSLCAGVSSNNPNWYSFFISYNLPLKVH